MASLQSGQTVLATVNNQSAIQGFRPRLIEFYGYEGEDFRHFQETLDSYLAIKNTHTVHANYRLGASMVYFRGHVS
ncbi:hypothetical protein G6F37_010145 [Rhizopus arrhizus]|nr:hypothetical protein G6F38_010279 [Rhizopus arrhizus]KAG1153671.1 hypothetical protein G6F37_010145 [Rhizopus arrhizus]